MLDKVDNYYTVNIDINIEQNVYASLQYLFAVVCLTKECYYEISFSDEDDSLILREDSRVAHHIYPNLTNYYHFKISDIENAQKVYRNIFSILKRFNEFGAHTYNISANLNLNVLTKNENSALIKNLDYKDKGIKINLSSISPDAV